MNPHMTKPSRSLRKEISLVLVIKLILLLVIWALFFQHPIEKQLNTQAIEQHIFRG